MSIAPNAVILLPLDITEAMIDDEQTTIPAIDPAVGEVAWDEEKTYQAQEKAVLEDFEWIALKENTGVRPGTDPAAWQRGLPTNRMRPFDDRLDTFARREGGFKYVLRPGFFTGLGIYGALADRLIVTIYDEPGGDIVEYDDVDMFEQAMGLYELLFMPLGRRTQFFLENLPLFPDAELHIEFITGPSTEARVALISVGHWDTLLGASDFGHTELGGEADVKSYSYRKVNDDGTVTRIRRGSSTVISCSVIIDTEQANHAVSLLHEVQGRPVAFIASGLPRYEFLNSFGDVSGSASVVDYGISRLRLKIEGAVQA